MADSVDLNELADDRPQDFRRANGAPMVMIDGKNERFARPSGFGKDLDDESALVNWKLWTAMAGVAQSKALQAEVVATKDEDRATKGALREKAIQTGRGNEASDTGTALHAMSERYEDPDDGFDPPEEYAADLAAYGEQLERYALVSEMSEFKLVNTDYRVAGTCDRLYRLTKPLTAPDGTVLPVGTLIVGDLKTGKKLDFSLPGYSVQMALYAQGQMYDIENEKVMPTPEINQKWGMLVHLPVGKAICEFRWVDLEVGNWGAWLTSEVRQWRRKWKRGDYDAPVAEPPTMEVAEIAESLGAEVIDLHHVEWVDMMSPFVQSRIQAIGKHKEARQALMRKWPVGVPTVKQGIEDPQHLTQVLDILDKIESDHSLQFPTPDPRVPQGVHKDDINISNQAPSAQDTKDNS